MRYKIKAPSLVSFRKAEKIARADTQVFVALTARRVLSVGDLSESARLQLVDLGATILPDTQYSLAS